MERTLLSFNFPNFFTVAVMAFGAYVVVLLVSQFILHRGGMTAATGSY